MSEHKVPTAGRFSILVVFRRSASKRQAAEDEIQLSEKRFA